MINKNIFYYGLLWFVTGRAEAVSGHFGEPYQIGIALKNKQPCFYLHSKIPISSVLVSVAHPKYGQSREERYLGGIGREKTEHQNMGHDIRHCVLADGVSFDLDTPYIVEIFDKQRDSAWYVHTENFCIRQKDRRLFVSDTFKNPNDKGLSCSDKPLPVRYAPKPPQETLGLWKRFLRWFSDGN
ncbi:hypothetical protein [Conchiformibius kuhniae]|uniref:Uncharacterized protein n=1 Tax=Conchiformibius kuhniae TaxID=211502 RepID=A0A8T9MY44_9NEIS|nr:hypothetical protein [Conchiformibius kuhniae]UOP05122.1 hypothetical protein LVJ77_02260 [Conchiformibius kuhniae]